MSAWRYLAQRLAGPAAGEIVHWDVPISGVEITDTLSGPIGLTGTIPVEVASLRDLNGDLLLQPWATAIWAEADDQIRGGGILVSSSFGETGEWELDCMGYAGYPAGMPFTESWFGVEIDPLDVLRKIWDHLQQFPDGDLGLEVDDLKTGLKIGTELEQTEFDTESGPISFESGPVKLNWYSTDDLGKEIDDLAEETPFDYHEEHYWDGEVIRHRLRLAYPRMGRRRDDLRFVLGENISVPPAVDQNGDDFANAILALGAGEGRETRRSLVGKRDGRLRRVKVVTDKALHRMKTLEAFARRNLAARQAGLENITEVIVRDHPNARIGSWHVGDEIFVESTNGFVDVGLWCRILSSTVTPDEGDAAHLTVARSEAVF